MAEADVIETAAADRLRFVTEREPNMIGLPAFKKLGSLGDRMKRLNLSRIP